MENKKYTLDEFILNESFQRYVLNPTPKDTEYWNAWMAKHPDAEEIMHHSKEIIAFTASHKLLPQQEVLSKEVYSKLQKQIENENRIGSTPAKSGKLYFLRWAAAFLLLIAIATLIRYAVTPSKTEDIGQFLEVIVPEGQRSQILLPDGTRVWLNSGSRFKYPTEFLKEKRDVYIEGEAFFDVSHNHHKPFIVHTRENLLVKVLGTQFNVKCYTSDKTIETTLVKGSIKLIKINNKTNTLQELDLKPNEKAIYEKKNKNVKIASISSSPQKKNTQETIVPVLKQKTEETGNEMEVITAWKDDALVFYDETFQDICVKMERWFGMKITIRDEDLKEERFTGKFVNKETIYQILDIINRSEAIRYTSNNKEIIISKKK